VWIDMMLSLLLNKQFDRAPQPAITMHALMGSLTRRTTNPKGVNRLAAQATIVVGSAGNLKLAAAVTRWFAPQCRPARRSKKPLSQMSMGIRIEPDSRIALSGPIHGLTCRCHSLDPVA
jgi:hypothetical protein